MRRPVATPRRRSLQRAGRQQKQPNPRSKTGKPTPKKKIPFDDAEFADF
jgi:hypothetical protein